VDGYQFIQRMVFEEFVLRVEKFLRKCGLPRKALLLVDNAPSHSTENELVSRDIKIMFLPPNVTALLQPMDQGVLENLKRNYRRFLLERILETIEEEQCSLIDSMKKINIKDVLYWIADSWNKVKESTLQKSWTKIIVDADVPVEEDVSSDETKDLYNLITNINECADIDEEDFTQRLGADDQEEFTDSDLVRFVSHEEDENEVIDDEMEEDSEPAQISHADGMQALERSLQYIEQQPDATPTDILLLRRWRHYASRKRMTKLKQASIS
jgi:hypothetical protein